MSIVFQKFLGYEFVMNIEFFILDGYGQYVWPAFIFTIVSCFSLYLKTSKEFKKQEKIYLKEFEQLQTINIEVGKRRETNKEVLSGSSI